MRGASDLNHFFSSANSDSMRIELKKNQQWRISMIEILQLPLLGLTIYFNFFQNPWSSIHILKFILALMFIISTIINVKNDNKRVRFLEISHGAIQLHFRNSKIDALQEDISNIFFKNTFDNIIVFNKTNNVVLARINKKDVTKDELRQLLNTLGFHN